MIRLGIVDDYAIVRAGLRDYFAELADFEVVGEASNGHEAKALARNGNVDVLLLDISMPGESGLEVLRDIRTNAPDLRVLVLSGFPQEHYAVRLLREGARGYLTKDCDAEEIATAIRAIAAGRRYVTPELAYMLAEELTQKKRASFCIIASHRAKLRCSCE